VLASSSPNVTACVATQTVTFGEDNANTNSNVYLTIKTSASHEACIVEHPYANNF
jgi:hypothetical protein